MRTDSRVCAVTEDEETINGNEVRHADWKGQERNLSWRSWHRTQCAHAHCPDDGWGLVACIPGNLVISEDTGRVLLILLIE